MAQVWEFNHVPRKDKWSLTDRPGYFRIYSQYAKGFEWARNSLTQKVSGPYSIGTAALDLSGLQEGDFAGNGIMGKTMYQLGVKKKIDGYWLEMRQGDRNGEIVIDSLPIDSNKVYLRTEITRKGTILFYYSLNNVQYERFGPEGISNFWGFLGIRHALCCYNLNKEVMGGYADFDYFEIDSSHRGNHYDAFAEIDFSQYDNRKGMKLVRLEAKRPMQFLTDIENGDWLVFNNIHFRNASRQITVELQAEQSGGILEIRKQDINGKLVISCPIAKTKKVGEWERQTFIFDNVQEHEKLCFLFRGNTRGLSIKSFLVN